jgi:hypothetical protein
MKKWLGAIVLIFAVGLVCWWAFLKEKPGENITEAATPSSRPHTETAGKPAQPVEVSPSLSAAFTGNASPAITLATPARPISTNYLLGSFSALPEGVTDESVLDSMRTAVRQYHSMYRGNPVGNNVEITTALNGDNPRQVKFINPEAGLRINGSGELVDTWGTPFFFHQVSADEMEIRSAGPDHKMWTGDDLTIK